MGARLKQSGLRKKLKWAARGFKMGRLDAEAHSAHQEASIEGDRLIFDLNKLWFERVQTSQLLNLNTPLYNAAVKGYIKGYCQKSNLPVFDWLLLPMDQSVGAIISFDKHEKIALRLLDELEKLPFKQVICVVSGQNEKLLGLIRQRKTATIVYYNEQISPEIARALGAKLVETDLLLFLDGRFIVTAEQLIPFMKEIARGTDIALNDAGLQVRKQDFNKRDPLPVTKEFINYCLGKPELGASSLQETPHVLTRRACQLIHPSNLVIPSKAYVIAMLKGMKIRPVRVSISSFKESKFNPSQKHQLLLDQIESLRLLVKERGMRLHFPDVRRKREIAEGDGQLADNEYHHSKL